MNKIRTLSNQKEKKYWLTSKAKFVGNGLVIDDLQVMQKWEEPIMDLLAKEVTKNKGDILEIGFGLGISATKILHKGCNSYTLIEAHTKVYGKAKKWKEQMSRKFPEVKLEIIKGFWQDRIIEINKKFDGILFDTSPTSETERDKWFFPFLEKVPKLLKKGGIFTYYSNETKNFNADHKEKLEKNFPKKDFEIRFKVVKNLNPGDCEYWNKNNMCIPIIKKREK